MGARKKLPPAISEDRRPHFGPKRDHGEDVAGKSPHRTRNLEPSARKKKKPVNSEGKGEGGVWKFKYSLGGKRKGAIRREKGKRTPEGSHKKENKA